VTTQRERGETFRAMHAGPAFIMPNPWDAGSARALADLGFAALATTSSGFAFTLGRVDGSVTLSEMAAHVRSIVAAVSLPLSADLENGYGAAPEDASLAIARVAEAGAVGGSIEDWDPHDGLYELPRAAERIAAAAETAHALAYPFTLTARAENHIREHPDLADTIARLQAYEAAGADVLYAPGLTSAQDVRTVCEAVGKPVNVLALPGMELREVLDAGARRVSVGGALTWAAIDAMFEAARALADEGSLTGLRGTPPVARGWDRPEG